jgi:hypothetical protein
VRQVEADQAADPAKASLDANLSLLVRSDQIRTEQWGDVEKKDSEKWWW